MVEMEADAGEMVQVMFMGTNMAMVIYLVVAQVSSVCDGYMPSKPAYFRPVILLAYLYRAIDLHQIFSNAPYRINCVEEISHWH